MLWIAFQTLLVLFSPSLVFAAGKTPKIDSGDTAWTLISCGMAFLIIPGLSFFYGGIYRSKSLAAILAQNYLSIGISALLWMICGYSLAFSGDIHGIIGDLNWGFLNQVGQDPIAYYSPTIPHLLFMMYRCLGAIIAPALLAGAFADRISLKTWLAVLVSWTLLVYTPVSHWVWSELGWIHQRGAIDYAGGMVIHMTTGYSALICSLWVERKREAGKADLTVLPPDTAMSLLGAGLLLFGWFAFDAAAMIKANGLTSHVVVATFLASSSGLIIWCLIDWIYWGKPSATGLCLGALSGIVAISSAASHITLQAAMFLGVLAGGVCNLGCHGLKERLEVSDSANIFSCHGLAGTLGSILAGVFATRDVNPNGPEGLIFGNSQLFFSQLIGTVTIALFSIGMTFAILKVIDLVGTCRLVNWDEEMDFEDQHTSSGKMRLHFLKNGKLKKSA